MGFNFFPYSIKSCLFCTASPTHYPDEPKRKEINYALVESTRPPMYKAMKYWGKKPHNIWAKYIENYCPKGGFVLDPFVGSGIAAFEATKLGRKAIALDLNPMSAFMIESLTSSFNDVDFISAFKEIYKTISEDEIYQFHFQRKYNKESCTVYNYKWLYNRVVLVALETDEGRRITVDASSIDILKTKKFKEIVFSYWYPQNKFSCADTIPHKFIKDIGGETFDNLWTKRNLYILSKIFFLISSQKKHNIKLQLLSAFVQTLHLCSRMVYPRSEKSNRDFSGSWGRADYMIRRKSMEQNPLIVFQRACLGRQSVLSAMKDMHEKFPGGIKINDITKSKKIRKNYDINYGIADIADLGSYVPSRSVDFVITDPPYAGLVQYMQLSLIWLVWLEKIDKRYKPDLRSEITLSAHKARSLYRRRLKNAFTNIHKTLKNDSVMVVTFHHKDIREWNDFVNSVRLSGFIFDKVTHQFNKRSGESNVSMPYGTSASDFYVRCVKNRSVDFTQALSGLEHFIVQMAIEIIALRNEPTPYNFIFNGLVPELLQAGLSQPKDSNETVEDILNRRCSEKDIFLKVKNTKSKAGDLWWFNKPAKHINYPDRPLQSRVEDTIISLLRRDVSVKFDNIIGEIFRTYPNGLTPDIRAIKNILEKFAYPSMGNWKIKEDVIIKISEHTEIIKTISVIAHKSNYQVHIGKRERSELCQDGKELSTFSDLSNLSVLKSSYNKHQIQRIEMVDLVMLKNGELKAAFEVENSTDFISALYRGSNIIEAIPKYMIIPDKRKDELLKIKDPLFRENFDTYNWSFITYTLLKRLHKFSKPSLAEFNRISKTL